MDLQGIRVYLDDERTTPEGWVRTYWPDEVIALLKTGDVCELSLDHDLGDDERGTGYDVVLWIEEAVALEGFQPAANPRAFGKLLCPRQDAIGHSHHRKAGKQTVGWNSAQRAFNHGTDRSSSKFIPTCGALS